MEDFLHYVWKEKLYSKLTYVDGKECDFELLDSGLLNSNSGPDFFNAKIRFEGITLAGNIEIHQNASDWFLHNHDQNQAYDSVILHVVRNANAVIRRTDGTVIPTVIMHFDKDIENELLFMLNHHGALPCSSRIQEIDSLLMLSWIDALTVERLEQKVEKIYKDLMFTNGDWTRVLFILLSRNFGFGINSDAFEQLARSIPLMSLTKHRDHLFQIEAILFGQAGLLDSDQGKTVYYYHLYDEYCFLQRKFNLKPLHRSVFKLLRMRPGNFPHVRIAQLAAIIKEQEKLFSSILSAKTIEDYRNIFIVPPSIYWHNHVHFQRKSGSKGPKLISITTLRLILINTVVPFLMAYGLKNHQSDYCERALALLRALPPEQNFITRLFNQAGLFMADAGESQAFLQLKKEYCDRKRCMDCRIGSSLLGKILAEKHIGYH